MDIAALSIGLNQMKVAQQASISIMKMAMDTAKNQTEDLTQIIEANTKMMELSMNPYLGSQLDVKI